MERADRNTRVAEGTDKASDLCDLAIKTRSDSESAQYTIVVAYVG